MKSKTNEPYHFANIGTDDLSHITELENSLSAKTSRNIVLIAYETENDKSAAEKLH